jgi:hypothetical protein
LREELFADPVAIRADTMPVYAGGISSSGTSRNDLIAGKVVVDYNVTSRGTVKDLRTEVDPIEFTDIQRMVHREIRRRLFRPRLADGEAVDASGLVYEHNFSYIQADLDKLRAAKAAAASKQKSDRD